MQKILGVRFKEVGKIYYFVYDKENVTVGDTVVAETRRGVECGTVVVCHDKEVPEKTILPDEKILRKATPEDFKSLELKKEEEKKAAQICKKKILEHKLKMKLIDVEYMFNRNKVIFYFVAESRVDFRNLVKELASIFKIRIELRQVGIRDETKLLGGLGSCGQALCCCSFLNEFQPVSIKMAKDQGISLNPVRLSGACGRLMCCLKYEEDTYLDILHSMPKVGSSVQTQEGAGTVVGQNVILNTVKVDLDEADEGAPPKKFKVDEIKIKDESSR